MTRATVSLNIYCEDKNLMDSFKSRLNKIITYSSTIDNNIENCIKNGQFEISENLLDEFYLKYNIQSPKEKIIERNITRLVHFTDESNIPSIIKNGLLPRSFLRDENIYFDYNDENRYDGCIDGVCLSVENPNQYLLETFKKKYPNKRYKLITINPSILYSSFINNDYISLTPRLYCNYNAAASTTKKSYVDIEIMFSEKVQTYYWKYGAMKEHDRIDLPQNIPTCKQAEIIFFGRIPPEYIESIETI